MTEPGSGQYELRYRAVSSLLQAGGPLALASLAQRCGVPEEAALPALCELEAEGLVVHGDLVPGQPGPHYCWAARWRERAQRRVVGAQLGLQEAMRLVEPVPASQLDVDSPPSTAFQRYVIHEYVPPPGKRFLALLQCSVRRPFSSSPSHAAMRRAIATATGCDPSKEFETCPVHVVVLASKIGPVPYELEDIYPANVRGGGVKHYDQSHYLRVKPVLARRLADYIFSHGDHYERIATFTEGRYAEVVIEAQRLAALRGSERADLAVLPVAGGSRIVRMGRSKPRQYWARYWIQLCLEVMNWLNPAQQLQARQRLKQMEVEYR